MMINITLRALIFSLPPLIRCRKLPLMPITPYAAA